MIAFFATKLGRSVILALAMSLAAGVTYWIVSHRAYERGVADCNAKHAQDVADANAAQAKRDGEQRAAASDIAHRSDDAAAHATVTTDAETATTKEVIHDVYHEVPVLVAGRCDHALDERVQERIDQAVHSANRP